MKVGDVSRQRRLTDPARRRWYAHHRCVRFARRMNAPAGSQVLNIARAAWPIFTMGTVVPVLAAP